MNPAPSFSADIQYLQRRSDNSRFAQLDADTMPALNALKLDMTRSAILGKKGDLLCVLTDVDVGQRKREPALLLANRRDAANRKVYILFNQLWLLIDPDINPEDTLTGSKSQAAQATAHNRRERDRALMALTERLYGFVTRDDVTRVIDAVFDCYRDIQLAKPPRWMTQAEWLHALAEDDMTVFENGVAVNR